MQSTINKNKVFSLVGVYADRFIDKVESVFGELLIYPADNTSGFTCSLGGEQKQIYGITPEYVIVMLVSWYEAKTASVRQMLVERMTEKNIQQWQEIMSRY